MSRTDDSALAASYDLCRRLHARHGRTYFLATRLLPPQTRPAVHALYGFARYVDDLVDVPLEQAPPVGVLDRIGDQLVRDLASGTSTHPVLAALVDTARRYEIPEELFTDFLRSMRMDLTPQEFRTWEELSRYTWGSAAVIGLQMTKVIGTVGSYEQARPTAAALGEAFQLTNFIRDYDEDRCRGRVYLPTEEFTAAGIEPGMSDCPALRVVINNAVSRAREQYDQAAPGIELLAPQGRDCIRTAFVLYRGILDEVERADYQVIGRRHAVPTVTKLRAALPAFSRAIRARRAATTPKE